MNFPIRGVSGDGFYYCIAHFRRKHVGEAARRDHEVTRRRSCFTVKVQLIHTFLKITSKKVDSRGDDWSFSVIIVRSWITAMLL